MRDDGLGAKGGTAARGNASSSLVATRKQTADWIVLSIGEPALCREAGGELSSLASLEAP